MLKATPGGGSMHARCPGRTQFIAELGFLPEGALVSRAEELLAAGLASIQLRGKGRSAEELIRTGTRLREATHRAGACFVVNQSVEAALALRADGLHLPADSPPPGEIRPLLPAGMALGMSCHCEAELARAQGADWILLSPVFATKSKPGASPLGTAELERLAALAPAPVVALGGVTASTAAACFAAGAAGVAAIRGFAGGDGERLIAQAIKSG
jgi:thiamine-phosphate pyrophosphorylase